MRNLCNHTNSVMCEGSPRFMRPQSVNISERSSIYTWVKYPVRQVYIWIDRNLYLPKIPCSYPQKISKNLDPSERCTKFPRDKCLTGKSMNIYPQQPLYMPFNWSCRPEAICRYMAEILQIRSITLSNQSINQSINHCPQ